MRTILVGTLLLAALASAACKTMKPVTFDQLNAMKPPRAWVTSNDQSVVLVSGPQVVGDTLVGYVNGTYEEMPRAQLKQVVVQAPAGTRTALLVGVITVGLGGFVYAITGSGGNGGRTQSDFCDKHPDDPSCNN
jgi:hypothetical protein